MTDITIVNQVGDTFTFQDGDVGSVVSEVVSAPDADPMPLSSPGEAFVFDLNGVLKSITIQGAITVAASTRVSGKAITSILSQKRWLEALQTGEQEPVGFTSNYESYTLTGDGSSGTVVDNFITGTATHATKVVVRRVRFEEKAADINRLPFTIEMVVGTD